MKRLLIILLAITIISIIFYCAGAFMSASLDLKQWKEITRELLAIFWLLFCVMISGIIFSIGKEDIRDI